MADDFKVDFVLREKKDNYDIIIVKAGLEIEIGYLIIDRKEQHIQIGCTMNELKQFNLQERKRMMRKIIQSIEEMQQKFFSQN